MQRLPQQLRSVQGLNLTCLSRGPHEWSSTAAFVDLPVVRERSTVQQSYDDARDVSSLSLRDDIGLFRRMRPHELFTSPF